MLMRILLRTSTPLHSAPSAESLVVRELAPGAEVERGPARRGGGRDWAAVTLDDGTRGFIDAAAAFVPLKPVRIVQAAGAALRAAPDLDARVRRQLLAGEEV